MSTAFSIAYKKSPPVHKILKILHLHCKFHLTKFAYLLEKYEIL